MLSMLAIGLRHTKRRSGLTNRLMSVSVTARDLRETTRERRVDLGLRFHRLRVIRQTSQSECVASSVRWMDRGARKARVSGEKCDHLRLVPSS